MEFEREVAVARAMEAFWTNGYAGTSPADLAEATGVGKGSLYNTFGSKRELFDKALDLYGQTGAEVTEECLFRQPGTAKERVRAYLRMLVDIDLGGPVKRGCLAANTALELGGRDEEALGKVRRMAERSIDLIAARIEQGKRDGDVASDIDAVAQAQLIQNTVAGLRIMAKGFDEQVLYRIIDTALAGL